MHGFLVAYAALFSNPIQDMVYVSSLSAMWALFAVYAYFSYFPGRLVVNARYTTSNRAAMNAFRGPVLVTVRRVSLWYVEQFFTDMIDRVWFWLNSEALFTPRQSVII